MPRMCLLTKHIPRFILNDYTSHYTTLLNKVEMTSLYNNRIQKFPVDLFTDFLEIKMGCFCHFFSSLLQFTDLRHLRARQTYRRLISDSRGFNNGKLSGELNDTTIIRRIIRWIFLLVKEYICCL